ncbi:MAG: hypothetical protein RJA70_4015, partial [Pseudomonadota bacterium]
MHKSFHRGALTVAKARNWKTYESRRVYGHLTRISSVAALRSASRKASIIFSSASNERVADTMSVIPLTIDTVLISTVSGS